MSIQRSSRIDRRTAEQLLAGAPMGAHESHPALAALLTAAAAPGRPDELAREQASMAAFRSAQLASAPRPRRLSAVRLAAMRVLTVKAAVALAATTAGGVAVAAGSGALPNPLVHRAPATSGLSAAQPAATQSLAGRESGDNARPQGPEVSKSPDSSHAPSPSLAGLCQAYVAGNKDKSDKGGNDKGGTGKAGSGSTANGNNASDNGANSNNASDKAANDRTSNSKVANDKVANDKAAIDKAKRDKVLDNPAFTTLVTAAGGKDKVDRFCLSLLAPPTPSSSVAPRGGKANDDRHGGQRVGIRDDDHVDGAQQPR